MKQSVYAAVAHLAASIVVATAVSGGNMPSMICHIESSEILGSADVLCVLPLAAMTA